MKTVVYLLIIFFSSIQIGNAQNKKIYVSKSGGTKKFLTFGKIGYNSYHFSNFSNSCDTLICSGSGFEKALIDKDIMRVSKSDGKYYTMFNKAISKSEKITRKSKAKAGQFNLKLHNETVSIKFSNADKKGNADLMIEVL